MVESVQTVSPSGKTMVSERLAQVLSTWNFDVLGHELTVSDIKALDSCAESLTPMMWQPMSVALYRTKDGCSAAVQRAVWDEIHGISVIPGT